MRRCVGPHMRCSSAGCAAPPRAQTGVLLQADIHRINEAEIAAPDLDVGLLLRAASAGALQIEYEDILLVRSQPTTLGSCGLPVSVCLPNDSRPGCYGRVMPEPLPWCSMLFVLQSIAQLPLAKSCCRPRSRPR